MQRNASQPDPIKLQEDVRAFRDQFNSVILSTATPDGHPNASYAPHFVGDEGEIFIFVSQLAVHTQNLQQNPKASLLFIQSEEKSRNLFARLRLTLDCIAEPIPRDGDLWLSVINGMQEKHGNMIELLRSLPDFQLFRFVIQSGDFVAGFGKAYRVTGSELLVDPEPRRS